jgi:23S rRNA (uracil1939-C5)-methyltransferase
MTADWELDISDLSHDGRGVAHDEGKTIFVTGALPGERVLAQRTQRHRHFDEAKIVQLLKTSEQRTTPHCAHFGVCGGCNLQHFAPQGQILAKQQTLLDNLERIGQIKPKRVLEPLTGKAWAYRRRGRLSVKMVEKKNRVLVGFRETNGRYVADIQHCPVLHPAIGERISALTQLIESLECKRLIPQIEFAVGDDQAALVFRNLAALSASDQTQIIAFGRDYNFIIFLQPGGLDSVHLIYPEQASLTYTLSNHQLKMEFSPLDFIQINADINAQMIDRALQLLSPTKNDRVLDLYCGLGNFTLPLARLAGHVVGIEGEHNLIARAKKNALNNNIDNAEFFVANLTENHRDAAWARRDYELMLLDPARVGAAEVLEYLPKSSVQRLVYVSCHPASLARDAGTLVQQHGFQLSAAGVMDMFPHTAHVESIALFERR